MVLLTTLTAIFAPLIQSHYGLIIAPKFISFDELGLLGIVMGVSLLASLAPGYGAYKLSLSDGLTPRI